jgi:two-component system response regulator MtrA
MTASGSRTAPSPTILIVEDDAALTQLLREFFEESNFQIVVAGTGAEAERMLRDPAAPRPDLIILDLILPDMDGLVLLANVRARLDIPVIVCTATMRRRDTVLAFRLGADDVVIKPFELQELEARVRAALRRRGVRAQAPTALPSAHTARPAPPPLNGLAAGAEVQAVGDLVIDHGARTVQLGRHQLHLTPTEYRMLHALASRPGEVFTRRDLARLVWGFENASAGRAIDVHVRRLRAKLAEHAIPGPPIVAIRGEGYKLLDQRRELSA